MVAFGKALKQSRRDGWETAYLDYSKLKRILSELEYSPQTQNNDVEAITSYSEETDSSYIRVKESFFQELGEEIEKVSLFTLKRQGMLSEGVGHLRFREDDTINVRELFPNRDSIFQSSTGTTTKPKPEDEDIEAYISLGVELLYLIQFVGVNALAVRKVLKKYNKIIRRVKPEDSYVMGGKDDLHLQLIANSQSVSAINSSLQTALTAFYVSESLLDTDSEKALKLFRFQSIIQAAYELREKSEVINQPFKEYLSRKAMISTGSTLGGIEGHEMSAMNEVLNFKPTDMLTSSMEELDQMWMKWIPQYQYWKDDRSIFEETPFALKSSIQFAMEALEKEEIDWFELNQRGTLLVESEKAWGGIDAPSMILNLVSILLYTINYYIIAPTANHYATVLGADGAYGATLIGTSSFSAIIAAVLYSFWYTKTSFKSALIFSTICPLCGNMIYSLAISYDSMAMAITGRFLCGFGSAEVINRQLISTCVSFSQITRASAYFVTAGAMGMSIGPLIAAILDDTTGRDFLVDLHLPFTPAGGIIFNSITSPGFFMATLWFMELLFLLVAFSEPERINGSETDSKVNGNHTERTSLIKTNYGSINEAVREENSDSDSVSEPLHPDNKKQVKGFWGKTVSVFSLIFVNKGLPVTLLLFCYIELADEVLISSCSMVVRRYFNQNASTAGYLVAR